MQVNGLDRDPVRCQRNADHRPEYRVQHLRLLSIFRRITPNHRPCNIPPPRHFFNSKSRFVWEQRRLGEWADRYDNLRIPIAANLRIPGPTPYYGANGIQDYVSGHTHDGEFVLVAEDGANDLKDYPVQYVCGKIWVNNHAHVIQAKSKIASNKFLKYVISQTDIEPFLVGGGRAKLNAETMMNIEIIAPVNLNEQIEIGEFFCGLDRLITLHQRE
ncbi:MAG: restriction endonuclease subunit S [Bacillota bacterium]